MCLGVPGRVVEVIDEYRARVDFWGVEREIRLEICDQTVEAGDYVLNHVGFAIRKIPHQEIQQTLELYEMLLTAADSEDMMADDIRSELAAAPASKDSPTDKQRGAIAAAPMPGRERLRTLNLRDHDDG